MPTIIHISYITSMSTAIFKKKTKSAIGMRMNMSIRATMMPIHRDHAKRICECIKKSWVKHVTTKRHTLYYPKIDKINPNGWQKNVILRIVSPNLFSIHSDACRLWIFSVLIVTELQFDGSHVLSTEILGPHGEGWWTLGKDITKRSLMRWCVITWWCDNVICFWSF